MEEAYQAWLSEAHAEDTETNRSAFEAGYAAGLAAEPSEEVPPDLDR